MSDLSPGERVGLRFRWVFYDAAARPVAVAVVLITLAVSAAMVSALLGASTFDSVGGLRTWVFYAESGFTTDVELGVLVAVLLLVVDARTGGPFRGQKSLFAVLAVIAAAGVVANIGTIVVYLSDSAVSVFPFVTTVGAWTGIITAFLASAVLASIAMWIALRGAVSGPTAGGS